MNDEEKDQFKFADSQNGEYGELPQNTPKEFWGKETIENIEKETQLTSSPSNIGEGHALGNTPVAGVDYRAPLDRAVNKSTPVEEAQAGAIDYASILLFVGALTALLASLPLGALFLGAAGFGLSLHSYLKNKKTQIVNSAVTVTGLVLNACIIPCSVYVLIIFTFYHSVLKLT